MSAINFPDNPVDGQLFTVDGLTRQFNESENKWYVVPGTLQPGPAGSQGPIGPTGPTGPTGPADSGTLTTKGDLLSRSTSTFERLPVGNDGEILYADATTTTGLIWKSPGTWVAYTPTWSAVTTDPVIGNGSILGKYIQIGKLVIAQIAIQTGSTTTYGSGVYSFSLPVTSVNPLVSSFVVGTATILDASTGANYNVFAVYNGTSTTTIKMIEAGGSFEVSHGNPIFLASGDVITTSFQYEAA